MDSEVLSRDNNAHLVTSNAKHKSNSKQAHNTQMTKHTDWTSASLQFKKRKVLSKNENASDIVNYFNNKTY